MGSGRNSSPEKKTRYLLQPSAAKAGAASATLPSPNPWKEEGARSGLDEKMTGEKSRSATTIAQADATPDLRREWPPDPIENRPFLPGFSSPEFGLHRIRG